MDLLFDESEVMTMKFIRTSLLKDHTAASETITKELPSHPLSHLIISLDCYNATDEATLAEILAFLTKVTVTHDGRSIISLLGADLYGLNAYIFRRLPTLEGRVATDNQRRSLGLIVPFGRRIMNPDECYPGSDEGELTLGVEMTAPATSCDNGTVNIEVVQLPEATPSRYLKAVTKTVTAPGATGENEVKLPIGNEIAALAIRMTTFSQASSHSYGVDGVSVLLDELEEGYAYARAQCLVADMINRVSMPSGVIAAQGAILPANTVWVDYDPNSDGQFLLDTAGANRCHAVLDMGVDEATYVTPYELVKA